MCILVDEIVQVDLNYTVLKKWRNHMDIKRKVVNHDVFISYRRADKQTAALTYYFLENMGYDVWWDAILNYDMLIEDEYPSIMDTIIENCNDFILLVTEHTFEDKRINEDDDWVRREIKCALSNGRHIIPLQLNGCNVPENLPEDISSLSKKKQFYPFPIDPYSKTTDEIRRFWKYLLKSTPSFIGTNDKDLTGTYNPDLEQEIIRAKVQAKNTKSFDMQVINNISKEFHNDNITVLDVGCGNGSVGRDRFANQCFSKVLGIDKSKDRIMDAHNTTTREEAKKFKYALIDMESGSFQTDMEQIMTTLEIEGFDIIFVSQVLHFHREKEPLNWLLDLKRLLNPNGYIIVKESDDGNKIAYGSYGQDYLEKILTMTTALRKVADRHMGRQLSSLLKGADFHDVKIYNFMRDTSSMEYSERMDLYQESFGWRLNAVQGENDLGSLTVKEMKDNLQKLKTCFERSPKDFWYCEYDYVCVGRAN